MNHTDHEIEMARSELYSIAKYAIALHEMLENVSELEGMEGWQQSKITKAADYMESVYQSLTHEMKFGESAPKGWEGTVKAMKKHKEVDNPYALAHYMKNKGYKSHKKEESVAEGSDNKVANHNAAVAKLPGGQAHRSNHPDILKTAPKGYSFSVSHKLVPDEQGVAEGADDKFSVADKVEELVDQYRLYDKRGWTDLFTKLAGRKLEVAEIRREMEYASKFLDLLDSIRMRSDYRGQQDPRLDQELIDLSNQWLGLFNKATGEFKGISGQGVAEAEKKGLYYYVNKRKKAGTSRDADSPKAPTAQAWKDAAKTAKKEDVAEAGYGRNKGYAPGFASPTAPPLRPVGGPKQDDEYVNGGPVNNIEVSINGRPWKIFPGAGPDGSRAFFQQKQDVDEMCKRKTAATGKKWSWGVTGDPATNESVEENKKGVRAVKHTTKPRNPVMAGDKPGKATITHKNKKKDADRGVEKHKGKEPAYESRLWNALSNHLEK
jgi:hypothetical protein